MIKAEKAGAIGFWILMSSAMLMLAMHVSSISIITAVPFFVVGGVFLIFLAAASVDGYYDHD